VGTNAHGQAFQLQIRVRQFVATESKPVLKRVMMATKLTTTDARLLVRVKKASAACR
jgi:hypothetical protein